MSDSRGFQTRVRWISAVLTILVLATGTVGVWRHCSAELREPTSMERYVTQIVTALMKDQHLSRRPIDDDISKRAFKLFFDGLDPLKLYFYQSDIDGFRKYEDKLDDMVAQDNTRFAHLVFDCFLERAQERVAVVDELLQGTLDFTVDEELITDPDLLEYPRDAGEARERWRKRIKYDLLVIKAGDAKKPEMQQDPEAAAREARETVSRRYQNVARRMGQLDNDDLLELFLGAITSAFDPHTSYMSPSSLENFRIALRLKLEGIGAQLQDRDGKTIVAKIVPGGAADKDGKLKKEDQIVSVGQEGSGEMEDIVGMKLNDVVQRIRGDAGTVVRLGVIPAGTNEQVTYSITRARIELEDSAAHGEVFEVGSRPDGTPLKVGVVDLPSFYQDMQAAQDGQMDFRSATKDVDRILKGFRDQGVDAVVLDLRLNGGGSLVEAVEMTGLFIDEGPVVQVKGFGNRRPDVHEDEISGMAWDGPLVVITSKLSASASEILAGAIQDYRRGLVVGDESTHGKGTVQSLRELGSLISDQRPPNLGALKITVQQFFRPGGDSTQKRGVLADITLPSITNYMDIGEADLEHAVEFDRVDPTGFVSANLVTPEIVTKLRAASDQRIGQSEEFAKLLKRIQSYRERKDRKSITLNKEKFLAEGSDSSADQDEQERLVEELTDDDTKIHRDYYLDEVLSITRDYLKAIQQGKFARVN